MEKKLINTRVIPTLDRLDKVLSLVLGEEKTVINNIQPITDDIIIEIDKITKRIDDMDFKLRSILESIRQLEINSYLSKGKEDIILKLGNLISDKISGAILSSPKGIILTTPVLHKSSNTE